MNIQHPLSEGITVEGTRPSCPCRGAKMLPYKGVIKKVIANPNGTWYYLDTGITVKDSTVTNVL